MNPEMLNALNESMVNVLLMLIEGITLIFGLVSALFVIFCLGGAAFGAFAEVRQPARLHSQPAAKPTEPTEPDEYDLLAVLASLEDSPIRETVYQQCAGLRRSANTT